MHEDRPLSGDEDFLDSLPGSIAQPNGTDPPAIKIEDRESNVEEPTAQPAEAPVYQRKRKAEELSKTKVDDLIDYSDVEDDNPAPKRRRKAQRH